MKIILDDIACRDGLYPFTLTRSAADIRCGILTFRERWEIITGRKIFTLTEVLEKNNVKDSTIIPANLLPSEQLIKKWKDIKKLPALINESMLIEYPFHLFQQNDIAIKLDYELLTKKRRSKKISYTNRISGKNVFLEEGAVIEHCIINSSGGPVYFGKNARVLEGSCIYGPFAMGEGSILKMGSRIYGATSVGPFCIAGGEIKNSILSAYSNKAHDGYLGDSVIGEWCNLGAGTSTSNIKNTAGMVSIWNDFKKESIPAGLKCGLMMGDYSRAAINTSFNTGTVTGAACNIFSKGFPDTFIQSFSWGNENYQLDKALDHINNWKKLKGLTLSPAEKEILTKIYQSKN